MPDNAWRKILAVDIFGVGMCVILSVVCGMVVVWPMVARQSDAAARFGSLSEQRSKAEAMEVQVRESKDALDSIQIALAHSPLTLESEDRLNDRLAGIAEHCKKCGMVIESIIPSAPVHGEQYDSVSIRLLARGSYQNCLVFLHGVHQTFLDTAVEGFDMSGNTEHVQAPLSAQFDIIWYAKPPTVAQTE